MSAEQEIVVSLDIETTGLDPVRDAIIEIGAVRFQGNEVLDEWSIVTAPYTVDGDQLGVLGVIGPTRMAYDRIIPIVDITAKLLSSVLRPD